MFIGTLRYLLGLIALIMLFACKKQPLSDDIYPIPENNPVADTCHRSWLPVVMIHGFLGSGDTYANFFMHFASNGYCPDRLFTYDWNSLTPGGGDVSRLDAFVDAVLAATGAQKIILMGHSAGGGLGYNYLADHGRAAKVEKYIHIASSPQSAPAGPSGEIPTLNLYSDDDQVVSGAAITGATNVMLSGLDHYQVATSAESFREIYLFIHATTPPYAEIQPESVPCIAGKALTFGENSPSAGATIKIYELNPATGERLSSNADTTIIAGTEGEWGPVVVKAGSYYEFEVSTTNAGDRVVHYYREPFLRSNWMVYLRTVPPAGSLASLLLSSLPRDDDQAVMAVFSSSQAVIHGRDVLFVDSVALSTPQHAPASETAIAFFLYDNGDGQTSGNSLGGLFGSFPFLAGVDVYLPANPPATIPLNFNGRQLHVRNWRSASEGLVVPVFN
ncbi:MAG: hypothetical protein KatS3mg031_2438 [Chitinophagales bacterium]|nr:MAG: hypothetical protein KatS3mg031_2438 [Chitinophagales bacterium]